MMMPALAEAAKLGAKARKSGFDWPEWRDLLPKLISGEIGCSMGLTEPDAGTNTLEIRSFARAQGDGWVLNGRKIWITAVDAADKMLVIAGVFMMVAQWVDVMWMVQPEFFKDGPRFGITEIGVTLGFLGLFALVVSRFLA